MNKKRVIAGVISVLILACAVAWCVYDITTGTRASHIETDEAQRIINEQFDKMAVTEPLRFIASANNITVHELSYGQNKDVAAKCTVDTIAAHAAVKDVYGDFLDADVKKKNSTMFKSSLDFKMEFEDELLKILEASDKISGELTIILYDTENGFKVYADDKTVNTVFGGVTDIKNDVSKIDTVIVNGAEQKIKSTNVNKGFVECFELRVTEVKPETATGIVKIWNKIKSDFHVNFVKYGRWKTIFKGLWVTIKLTLCALVIGVLLGFVVAFIRCTYLKNTKHGILLKFLNGVCQVYLTVIRGTPAVVQIMIIYFVIFMPMGADKFLSAVVCFGLNSGAYVAEIVRGGIMNVDDGQIEAGRSLGFNYMQTMYYIVLPQAFKAVLPALANEFVVLLKETSVAFYIGLGDLMYAGNAIRSATYSPFMPLVAVALIYLVMVIGLSRLVGMLERRLRTNER